MLSDGDNQRANPKPAVAAQVALRIVSAFIPATSPASQVRMASSVCSSRIRTVAVIDEANADIATPLLDSAGQAELDTWLSRIRRTMERVETLPALADAIAQLPERERLVLALYYDEELNLKEIGEVLGVSESRVSQLHSQCVARLRARLGEWRVS